MANQALIDAAEKGDVDGVKKALESGAKINYSDRRTFIKNRRCHYYHITALGLAVQNDNLSVVKHLVESGATPYSYSDYDGQIKTPRDWANKKNQQIIVRYLERIMQLPKWLNKFDTKGFTPLTRCCSRNWESQANILINFDADVCKSDKTGKTPLIYAIANDNFIIVSKLLQKGAIASGMSAVKCAIEQGRNNILGHLMNTKEIPIDVILDDGFTPLTKAIAFKNSGIAKYLVEEGADPLKIDLHNNNPVEKAMELHLMEVAKAIVSKYVNAKDTKKEAVIDSLLSDGYTLLTKSIATYNLATAKFLIENGADPEKADKHGNNPLEQALEINFMEIAQMLLTKGLKISKTIKPSLFRQFAEDGAIKMYEFLIKNDWDVNQSDENGKTALALSAENKNLLLSRLLIENGAKMDLAKEDIEEFRKNNYDFDLFMKNITTEKEETCRSKETGQE